MKNKRSHIVGTVPKCNTKIVERGKIDTPNTIHDRSLSRLGTGASITCFMSPTSLPLEVN